MLASARQSFFVVLPLAAVVALAGCGGDGKAKVKTHPVSGTVKYADGSPLTAGYITFEGERISARGKVEPDGTFVLGTYDDKDGAPAGNYKIFFTSTSTGGSLATGEKPKELVDPKFNDATKSGLTREVKAESNKFDDIVVSKPGG